MKTFVVIMGIGQAQPILVEALNEDCAMTEMVKRFPCTAGAGLKEGLKWYVAEVKLITDFS